MPEKKTIERARKAKREGKAPTTQAGEFVREEIEHIRGGKHGARNAKQAIAIGLSKARRAGVKLPAPKKGTASERTRKQAKRATAKAKATEAKPTSARRKSPKRARRKEGPQARAPHGCVAARALTSGTPGCTAPQEDRRTALSYEARRGLVREAVAPVPHCHAIYPHADRWSSPLRF
jgi:hypothetical protein